MYLYIRYSSVLTYLAIDIWLSQVPYIILVIYSYVLENCPGDTIDKITTSEHDGGYSLSYEARQNASKLNQAVKTINAFEKRTESCQYHRSKGLTREPNDTGGPDLETKIVELQIAISNAKTDKAKAEARLDRLREGGIAVDEYIDAFVVERRRQQEAAERQRALDAQAAATPADAVDEDQDEDNFDLREVCILLRHLLTGCYIWCCNNLSQS